MTYKVLRSSNFEKVLRRYPRELLIWISKVEGQLAMDPYTGDPLRVPWLREKKFGKFRLYFLIFEKEKVVSLAGLSDKKDQQESINGVLRFLEGYRVEMEDTLRR